MKKQLNCLLVDDEQPALNILTAFTNKTPFLALQAATTNAFEALDILNDQSIDLLFLDIQMPDLTGIQLLQSLEKRPLVIFTTAFDEYALKGYELDIVDYLLKPIPFPRFIKAANKALKIYEANQPQVKTKDYILIKADYQTKKDCF